MARRGTHGIWAVVNLLQAAAWLREELNSALLEAAGVSLAEQEAMVRLLHHGPRVPLGHLAQLVLFTQSGVTRLIDRLEAKGYVRRELSSEDRRLTYAALTDDGRRKLVEEINPIVARVVSERFTRHLEPDEIVELRRILLALIRANGWWDERRHAPEPPLELRRSSG